MFLLRNVDWLLLLPAVFLVTVGSLVLFSVSPSSFPQHFFYLSLALSTFLFASKIDVQILKNASPFLYLVSCVLLLATVVFGAFVRGASRWLVLGPVVFQPSEITKPLLLLFFAMLVSSQKGSKKFLFAIIGFIPTFLLVAAQPDLGSSIVLAAGFLGVLFFSGFPLWWFGAGSLTFLAFAPLFWRGLAEYQKQRILTFLSPAHDPLGAGYNSLQAMIAVGSGGLFGKGLGQGTQSQLAFLPERHTDFIFAALSEELGFLGASLTVCAFCILLYRIITILRREGNIFVQSFLGGVFMIVFTHVVVNIGMNAGILPITGIPLPFVSSGGSALLSFSFMLGLISGISTRLKNRAEPSILSGIV